MQYCAVNRLKFHLKAQDISLTKSILLLVEEIYLY